MVDAAVNFEDMKQSQESKKIVTVERLDRRHRGHQFIILSNS